MYLINTSYKGSMKKLIFIVLFVVIAVIAGGYAVWKSNQPSQWDVNLAQAVEDETAIVYYDSPIKSNTGVIGIWNKNDFPIDVYFYPYDGDAPVYGGNNVSEMDIPADSQVIGIPLDIDKKYTLGIHADVEENTEIHVIIQDGNETL